MLDHQRLDAYRIARELHLRLDAIAKRARARPDLADQLRRAATSIVLNIAEGAGEFSLKEKARFYRIAKRSGTECSAILDLLGDLNVVERKDLAEAHALLVRTFSMLIKLSKSAEPAKPARR